jgi:pimeloyl-ACP methyl ester carboxylesterase
MKPEFITVDGLKTCYLTTGSGSDVCLLHGWGCDHHIWNGVQEHLQEGFRVTSIDFPGFGLSDEPPVEWGVGEYTAWFEKFIALLGITNPILIGHSFGGRVSLLMASRGETGKIILIDSAGIKPRRSLEYYLKVYSFKAMKHLAPLLLGEQRAALLIERRRAASGSSDYNAASGVMRRSLVKTVNEDLRGVMSRIEVPTLLIWGSEDRATPLRDGRLMEKKIKDAGLVVFEGAGHYSFLEQSARFAAIVDNFLAEERNKQDTK